MSAHPDLPEFDGRAGFAGQVPTHALKSTRSRHRRLLVVAPRTIARGGGVGSCDRQTWRRAARDKQRQFGPSRPGTLSQSYPVLYGGCGVCL